jgi:hypothetical protein
MRSTNGGGSLMDAAAGRLDRRSKWLELLEQQEKSGLSQAEFCRQNNLSKSNFVYYKGTLKTKNNHSLKPAKLFSPVKLTPIDSIKPAEIKIILPNGFQCFIPSVMDVLQIKRLMEALLSC